MSKRKFFILLFFCLTSITSLITQPDPTAFVWTDQREDRRLQVAFFRYTVNLKEAVVDAQIHLFADSRYHLLVNGHFVNFGPARFYPEHPEYDSYDLSPYLRPGENVIAVKVMSNGVSTFQLRRNQPGFIAWGKWRTSSGNVDLSTPGNWKTYLSKGYDANAARMSFALGPMEVYDARKDKAVKGWTLPGFDDSNWESPAVVKNETIWGPLQARSIPHLTQENYLPYELLGMYDLRNEEDVHSFQVLTDDKSWEGFRKPRTFIGYTYLYSPVDQTVDAGIWWGEHFLNGEGPLNQSTAPKDQVHRQQTQLELRQGWNYFFVKRKAFFGKWAFQLAVPQSSGISLSPNKVKNDSIIFMTAGPFVKSLEELRAIDVTTVPKGASWNWQPQQNGTGNPATEMAWQYFGEEQPIPPDPNQDITIESPSGMALVYDFRYKKLGRIIVEYEAPEGTILDVGFTEDLIENRPHLMKRVGLYMATRHIAAGGKARLETFKPYGLRYLQINVQHNKGAVVIKRVAVVNQVYPFEELGDFQCSDPLFNQIWQLGWRTLQVCAEDSYTDTPFRERGLYAGDMLPQMALTLVGSGDLRLVRRSLSLFQDMYIDQFNPEKPRHPDEIGLLEDYPLLTLEALSWYVDRTNDLAFAQALLPAYQRLVKTWLDKRDENGIVYNKRVFIEWTKIEKSEVNNTAFHAILARSCLLMARLFEKNNQLDSTQFYLAKYSELIQSINAQFWDDQKQRYTDGIKATKRIDHSYPISNAWPYIAGATDSNKNQSILPFIASVMEDIGDESRNKKATPYGSFYLFAALYDYGMPEVAERFIRKHWGPMIYRHNDTAWENFDDDGIGTLSHAWSGAPTYYLTTQVLGVDLGWPHPSDPDTIVIAPQTASVDWARGTVPHPKGLIEVAWEVRGNHLWMECQVPNGLKWTVKPKGRLGKLELWVNGEKK